MASLLGVNAAVGAAEEIQGKVTELNAGRARVELQGSGVGIGRGDAVRFITLMDGFEVAAGSGTIAEVGSGFLWVEQVDSRVTIGMDARITAGSGGGVGDGVAARADEHSSGETRAGLDLDQLLARHLEAIGGRLAWEAVKSLRLTCTWAGPGPTMLRTITLARPQRFRDEGFDQKWGGNVIATDGEEFWSLILEGDLAKKQRKAKDPAPAPEALGQEAVDEHAVNPVFLFGGWMSQRKQEGLPIELVGREDLAGSSAYRVDVPVPSGERYAFYLDSSTFLIIARVQTSGGNSTGLRDLYTDYRKVGFVTLAHKVTTQFNSGGLLAEVVVERVEVNPAVDADLFGKP
jgi:hypothetical protein